MTRMVVVLLLAGALLAAPHAAAGQDPLAAAQKLYVDARYEDALRAYDEVKAAVAVPPAVLLGAQQGRALCLLALERRAEAQQAVESILDVDPLYALAGDEASPKVRAAFREMRRRALPGAVQQAYTRAKQAYDRKAFTEAATGFSCVLALLDDDDLSLDTSARADMRLVAKAFLDLADASATPAPASRPVPVSSGGSAPADPASPGTKPSTSAPDPIYDASSKDVVAPMPLRTDVQVPDAMRPTGVSKEVVVELTVGRTGIVESATIRQSSDGVFNALVSRAVLDWRYRPALKGTTPVRYRMMVKVVIAPRGSH